MEHLYLVEIFIKKVNLISKHKIKQKENEKLSVNVDFGKIASFVIRQDEFETEISEKASEEKDIEIKIENSSMTVDDSNDDSTVAEEASDTSKLENALTRDGICLNTDRSVSFQLKNSQLDSKDESVMNDEFIENSKRNVRLSSTSKPSEATDSEAILNHQKGVNSTLKLSVPTVFESSSLYESASRRFSDNTFRYTHIFNAGASLLFSSHSENLVQTFRLFPLELSVWSDSEYEKSLCIGITQLLWDTDFYFLITDRKSSSRKPVTLKEKLLLRSEYSSSVVGDMILYVRLTCLGQVVLTRFKEIPDDSNNKAILLRGDGESNLFKCEPFGRGSELKNFLSVGPICDTLTIEDPDETRAKIRRNSTNRELRKAGLDEDGVLFVVGDHKRSSYGENRQCGLPFPCGNPDCKLTELVKIFLSQADGSTKESEDNSTDISDTKQKCKDIKRCCSCISKESDTSSIVDSTQSTQPKSLVVCEGCGGLSFSGKTCDDMANYQKDKEANAAENTLVEEFPAEQDVDDGAMKFNDSDTQKCLLEGIAKMLSSKKNGTHKKYCVDYKHKNACPKYA